MAGLRRSTDGVTVTERRLPRPSEILPLIGRRDPSLSRLQARLERCASIGDVRAMARRRVPRSVFDYTDGAAGSEQTLSRSRKAYARVEFTPRVLRNVAEIEVIILVFVVCLDCGSLFYLNLIEGPLFPLIRSNLADTQANTTSLRLHTDNLHQDRLT